MEPAINLALYRTEVLERIKERNQQRGEPERHADILDEVQDAQDRVVGDATMEMEVRLLAQIDYALDKIKSGTYGVCEECGEAISEKRLAAIPWALCCVRCQEELKEKAA